MDKIRWQSKDYELSTYNLGLARLVEEAEKAETMIEAYEKQLEVVTVALGRDSVKECIGDNDIEKIDLVNLVLLYNEVIDGYEKRINDMRDRKDERIFNSAGIHAFGKVADDIRVVQSVEKMKR